MKHYSYSIKKMGEITKSYNNIHRNRQIHTQLHLNRHNWTEKHTHTEVHQHGTQLLGIV